MSLLQYRSTTVGVALQDALDEMLDKNLLVTELSERILQEFDERVQDIMLQHLPYETSQLHVDAARISSYRFYDHVWTFVLKDLNIPALKSMSSVDKLKIIACDIRIAKAGRRKRTKRKHNQSKHGHTFENSDNEDEEDD